MVQRKQQLKFERNPHRWTNFDFMSYADCDSQAELEMAHRGAKRMKIWAPGMHVIFIWILLTLNMSRLFWGHSVHFSQNWALTEKWLIVERNR